MNKQMSKFFKLLKFKHPLYRGEYPLIFMKVMQVIGPGGSGTDYHRKVIDKWKPRRPCIALEESFFGLMFSERETL